MIEDQRRTKLVFWSHRSMIGQLDEHELHALLVGVLDGNTALIGLIFGGKGR